MENRLKQLRKENSYTLDQFSEISGINVETLGRCENGEAELPIKIWVLLATLFRVDTAYLIGVSNVRNLDKIIKRLYRTLDFVELEQNLLDHPNRLLKVVHYDLMGSIAALRGRNF